MSRSEHIGILPFTVTDFSVLSGGERGGERGKLRNLVLKAPMANGHSVIKIHI
jgi:hypothetical protein